MIISLPGNSPFDPAEVKRLLHFAAHCADVKHTRCKVTLKVSRRGTVSGVAYPFTWTRGRQTRTVTLKVTNEPSRYPLTVDRRPLFILSDYREAIVYIAAHEFRHIRDMDKTRRTVNGKRVHDTAEGPCNMTARYAVLQWRKSIYSLSASTYVDSPEEMK